MTKEIDEFIKAGDAATPDPWSIYRDYIINSKGDAELRTWAICDKVYHKKDSRFIIAAANARQAIKEMRDENKGLHKLRRNQQREIENIRHDLELLQTTNNELANTVMRYEAILDYYKMIDHAAGIKNSKAKAALKRSTEK